MARASDKPTTLIAGHRGSRDFGTQPFLADALRATGRPAATVLYVGAASDDHAAFGASLATVIDTAGAASVLWPKLTGKRRDLAAVRAALATVDLVFVGGGDVERGMEVLREADLVDDIHAAARRGTVFVGMSAGAIMLGERWIRWPHERSGDDEAETYECLGLVPCSLDTHGEGEQWAEAKSFAVVRARELEGEARVYAIPSGAALVALADGTFQARGGSVLRIAAEPGQGARVEAMVGP